MARYGRININYNRVGVGKIWNKNCWKNMEGMIKCYILKLKIVLIVGVIVIKKGIL
jgi:hypothetical protein